MKLIQVALVISLLAISSSNSLVASAAQGNSLSDHWLPSQSCYRDELNMSDADYHNCWMDNAGKILVMSSITHDSIDASRSLGFIEQNLGQESSIGAFYLPELKVFDSAVNVSSMGSVVTVSNKMVELSAKNSTASHYDQLAIGTSYTGNVNLSYLGADRIWFDNGTFSGSVSSVSSLVLEIASGFSKRSLFNVGGEMYYVYLNASISPSEPFINASVQVEPLNSTSNYVKYVFVQAFNTTRANPFFGTCLYNASGSFVQRIPFRGSGAANESGILLSYSNATDVFNNNETGQDAVAIKFGSAGLYDWEHWARDLPFGHSWFGPGYYVEPNVSSGALSTPLKVEVYPILHFDYHLANDTVRYIASVRPGYEVSPPVGFGFISYGLALQASANPSNTTLRDLAKGYWNYYYSRYDTTPADYSTPYARSINLLAIAGFTLYGCNSTIENFARNFVGNGSSGSIEEYGWGAAALFQLKKCTGSSTDESLYNRFIGSITTNDIYYAGPAYTNQKPSFTYQYAEAASGLMLGSVPYNNPVVLALMSAVYQSNVSGVVHNQPTAKADLANTETLPAYMLSAWLFQNETRNATGYAIIALSHANITSIDYSEGTLLIGAIGKDGSLTISKTSQSEVFSINGSVVIPVSVNSTATATVTTTLTSLSTTTVTTTITKSGETLSSMLVLVTGVALSILGLFALAYAFRSRRL